MGFRKIWSKFFNRKKGVLPAERLVPPSPRLGNPMPNSTPSESHPSNALMPGRSPDRPLGVASGPVPGLIFRQATEIIQEDQNGVDKPTTPQDSRRLSVSGSSRPVAAPTAWSKDTLPDSIGYGLSPKRSPSVASALLEDEIMPETVVARIHVSFSRWNPQGSKQVTEPVTYWDPKVLPNFPWRDGKQDLNHYDKLIPTEAIIAHMLKHQLAYHKHYITYGSCCVKGPPDLEYDRHYKIISDYKNPQGHLRQEAIQQICGFINEHPFRSFTLDIHWEYSSARLELNAQPEEPSGYAWLIKVELHQKMHKNFENDYYIPKSDLDKFLDSSITKPIIKADSELRNLVKKEYGNDKQAVEKYLNDFASRIHAPSPGAAKLLLLCVHENISMTYLKHWLVYHGFHDGNIQSTECIDTKCTDGTFHLIKEKFPSFIASIIEARSGVWAPKNKILPIKKIGSALGDGNAGQVFPVTIDASHHSFSADPKCQFALKEFDSSTRSQSAFDREALMLKHLSYNPHPHVVMQITAWKSEKTRKAYILYPMAKYHLGEFLLRTPLDLDCDGMLWFLRQAIGLAEALYSIHNVRVSDLGNPNQKRRPQTEVDKQYEVEGDLWWCSHQDIKPENILVFEKLDNQHPIFKLSDLGAGYVYDAKGPHDKSEGEPVARGTYTYFAPDKDKDGFVSRPFDLWALGCCYLELLLWLFGVWHANQFAKARLHSDRIVGERLTSDRYWLKKANGDYDLKSAVTDALRQLREKHCDKMPAFQMLLDIIEKLFHLESKSRLKAVDLCKQLRELYRYTEEELLRDRDRYLKQYYVNHPDRKPQTTPQESPSPRLDHTPSSSLEIKQTSLAAIQSSLQPTEVKSSNVQMESPQRMEDELRDLEEEAARDEEANIANLDLDR